MNSTIKPELQAQLDALEDKNDFNGFRKLLEENMPEICQCYDLSPFEGYASYVDPMHREFTADVDIARLYNEVSVKVTAHHEDKTFCHESEEVYLLGDEAISYILIDELAHFKLQQMHELWERYMSSEDAIWLVDVRDITGGAYETVKDLLNRDALKAAAMFIEGAIDALFRMGPMKESEGDGYET